MKELFLCAALALPALPWSQDKVFDEMVRLMEKQDPGYTIVLVHKDEFLLTPGAAKTPLIYRDKFRVWVTRAA
jgi:hypothetical protein